MPPWHPLHPCQSPDTPHPSTGIYLSRVVLLQVSMMCHQPLGQADVLSYVPLHPHHCYMHPQCFPWRGIWWQIAVLHQVTLAFGQHLGQDDLLVVKSLWLIWAQIHLPPPYRHTLWTFHISVFVNTRPMIVNSNTIVYMCMEVIICQSDRFPERLMTSQTPSIGRTWNQFRWEKEHGGNSPSFWGEFCKTLPAQNRIFLIF